MRVEKRIELQLSTSGSLQLALQQVKIPGKQGIVSQETETGPVEDRIHDHGAAKQGTGLKPGHRCDARIIRV